MGKMIERRTGGNLLFGVAFRRHIFRGALYKEVLMKVGILSDSHGELGNLRKAAKALAEKVELIVHLGDDWEDCRVFEEMGLNLIRVPGVFSSYYQDPKITNRRVEEFNGWRVLLSHTPFSHQNDLPQDIRPEDVEARGDVEVILYGHTHIPNIEDKEGILWINSGHLKRGDKKGYPPSYAILDFRAQEVQAKIISFRNGELLVEKTFKRQEPRSLCLF